MSIHPRPALGPGQTSLFSRAEPIAIKFDIACSDRGAASNDVELDMSLQMYTTI